MEVLASFKSLNCLVSGKLFSAKCCWKEQICEEFRRWYILITKVETTCRQPPPAQTCSILTKGQFNGMLGHANCVQNKSEDQDVELERKGWKNVWLWEEGFQVGSRIWSDLRFDGVLGNHESVRQSVRDEGLCRSTSKSMAQFVRCDSIS